MFICSFLSLKYEGFDQIFRDEHKFKIIMSNVIIIIIIIII